MADGPSAKKSVLSFLIGRRPINRASQENQPPRNGDENPGGLSIHSRSRLFSTARRGATYSFLAGSIPYPPPAPPSRYVPPSWSIENDILAAMSAVINFARRKSVKFFG